MNELRKEGWNEGKKEGRNERRKKGMKEGTRRRNERVAYNATSYTRSQATLDHTHVV